MRWRDTLEPTRMARVALVAPADRLRQVLVVVADAGVTQLERIGEPAPGPAGEALERALRQQVAAAPTATLAGPRILAEPPDAAALEQAGRLEELAGEVELEHATASALRHGAVVAIVGWSPAAAVATLADRLAPLGGAVVRLPFPRWPAPPTLVDVHRRNRRLPTARGHLRHRAVRGPESGGVGRHRLRRDVRDDVRRCRPRGAAPWPLDCCSPSGGCGRLSRFRRFAPFVIGAGLASICFGLAFGEFFGPTHVVPTLWMAPLDDPTTLLAVAIAVGAALHRRRLRAGDHQPLARRGAGACRARVRGTGWRRALSRARGAWPSAGTRHATVMLVAGGVLAAFGLGLVALGSYLTAGPGPGRSAEAGVESFDAVVRIGTNTVSFARLAAFGLTHAALCAVVWSGTTWLWGHGPASWLAAVALFVAGNVVAFALEGLVVGVQALRLEYYELFSRIFVDEGRPFRPWHVPTISSKEAA